jgi:hypothetical protein
MKLDERGTESLREPPGRPQGFIGDISSLDIE